MATKKNLTKRLKTVFFGESLVFKGLRDLDFRLATFAALFALATLTTPAILETLVTLAVPASFAFLRTLYPTPTSPHSPS